MDGCQPEEPTSVGPAIMDGHGVGRAVRPNPGPDRSVANLLARTAAQIELDQALLVGARRERGRASFLIGTGHVARGGLHGDVIHGHRTRERSDRRGDQSERLRVACGSCGPSLYRARNQSCRQEDEHNASEQMAPPGGEVCAPGPERRNQDARFLRKTIIDRSYGTLPKARARALRSI